MEHAVKQAPQGWAEQLAAGLAELERGEVVPATEVHDMILTALAELESERAERRGSRKDGGL